MLTVIIPARNEKYLSKTIENILENAEGDIEVIAVCDGYWPDQAIKDDPRVVILHHSEARGQRQSINEAARIAKGKYIMKLDAHCAVDKGFDVKLAADCEYNWTVIPRMYNLNIETFLPKLHKRTDYMYIGWNEKEELRALYYRGQEYKRWHRKEELIDDTMCCMGPGWFMHKDRFWELGGCDEGHGSWGQQGIEVALKAWLSGGRLVVNKKTWFAHWFRGDVGFPYEMSGRAVGMARDYSKDLWLNNKWDKQVRTLDWLVEKFNPPTWENYMKQGVDQEVVNKFDETLRNYLVKKKYFPKWRGVKLTKYPNDILIYQEIIFQNKPDFIIDCGTNKGGSALFFANMCDLNGKGQVISIDKYTDTGKPGPFSGGITTSEQLPKHPRITYFTGGTTDAGILTKITEMVGTGSVMVSLDSSHTRSHVKRELIRYGRMVTPGQFLVVEDTHMGEEGPLGAVKWYLTKTRNYEVVNLEDRFLISLNSGGWLRRR